MTSTRRTLINWKSSKEECEDLRRRIKDGLLKQPTVGELDEKVVMLHKDITKHWLARELVLLKIRLDQANEKGWLHKVAEYVDRRKLLQTPDEQSRLLNEIPRVLPEKVEPETIPDDPLDGVNQNPDDSPKAADWDWEAVGVSTRVPSKQRSQDPFEVGTRTIADAQPSSPEDSSPDTEQVTTECNGNFKLLEPDLTRFNGVKALETERNSHAESMHLAQKDIPKTEAFSAGSIGQLLLNSMEVNVLPEVKTSRNVEIITLSDDEDEPEPPASIKPALPDAELFCWFYLDPMSRVQGPCSLLSLKRWSDSGYFQPDFSVWVGQTHREAVLLTDILGLFPQGD